MVQNGKEVLMIRVKQQKDRKQEQGGYKGLVTLLSFTKIGINFIGTSCDQEETVYWFLRDIFATIKL